MIIEDIGKAKQDLRKDIRKNLKLLPWYIISKWCIAVLGAILFFYIEECYHYVPVVDPNTVRCRELCHSIITDLYINETAMPATTTTTTSMTNSSISSESSTNSTLTHNNNTANYILIAADNTTAVQRLITSCIEKQCQEEGNNLSTGPTCSLTTDPTLFIKWLNFCFVVIFTIGR